MNLAQVFSLLFVAEVMHEISFCAHCNIQQLSGSLMDVKVLDLSTYDSKFREVVCNCTSFDTIALILNHVIVLVSVALRIHASLVDESTNL